MEHVYVPFFSLTNTDGACNRTLSLARVRTYTLSLSL